MKDTFITSCYKGFYIQSYIDRDLQKEIISVRGKVFKSRHAAKCYITRILIPEHDKLMEELLITK